MTLGFVLRHQNYRSYFCSDYNSDEFVYTLDIASLGLLLFNRYNLKAN